MSYLAYSKIKTNADTQLGVCLNNICPDSNSNWIECGYERTENFLNSIFRAMYKEVMYEIIISCNDTKKRARLEQLYGKLNKAF